MTAMPRPQDQLDLDGTVAAITGAGGGLGAGIARRFAAAGASLVLHHRESASRVEQLAQELGTATTMVQADLTAADGPAAVIEAGVAAFGHVDVVVNNAGTQPLAALAQVEEAEWDEVLAVNVTALHRLTRTFARHRRDHGGGGAVVNIASIEGSQPAALHGHYATSKSAVRMYTRAAAAEFGADGLRVNTVSPGLIHREGIEDAWPDGVARWHAAAPLERLGTPEDVGDACVFLASPMARWVTGAELVVDGGVLTRSTW